MFQIRFRFLNPQLKVNYKAIIQEQLSVAFINKRDSNSASNVSLIKTASFPNFETIGLVKYM